MNHVFRRTRKKKGEPLEKEGGKRIQVNFFKNQHINELAHDILIDMRYDYHILFKTMFEDAKLLG